MVVGRWSLVVDCRLMLIVVIVVVVVVITGTTTMGRTKIVWIFLDFWHLENQLVTGPGMRVTKFNMTPRVRPRVAKVPVLRYRLSDTTKSVLPHSFVYLYLYTYTHIQTINVVNKEVPCSHLRLPPPYDDTPFRHRRRRRRRCCAPCRPKSPSWEPVEGSDNHCPCC